ncbi:MAG: GGDEF domain-containing protein [Lachnospiraceae bacterium]|jgi:diguanylate cyclase (GGDEF)-like protein|nr:GGDEF domain-containing protein [Lachnospiraceae bacterium]
MEFDAEWLKPLLECAEVSFVADDETKQLLWLSGTDAVGEYCWQTVMGRQDPCPYCPEMKDGEFYSWDCYDHDRKRWLKVKYRVFEKDGKRLRAGNVNTVNDMMEFSKETMETLASTQALLRENARIKAALEKEAKTDTMTGLYNRNRFNLDIAGGQYNGSRAGAVYLDINNLKEANDQYHHEMGDKLIRTTASAIRDAAGQFPDACGYRIGGDEFVIMVKESDEEKLQSIAVRLRKYLQEHPMEIPCVVALGTAVSDGQEDTEQMVERADKAMYLDKRRLKGDHVR